jgi:hypothetical protein
MGLDNPAGENDKFDVDSLPDIAAQTSGRTSRGGKTTGGTKTTGGSKTGGTTSKTGTTTTPIATRNRKTSTVDVRDSIKSKVRNRNSTI